MSGHPWENRNRAVHVAVRDLVAAYLDAKGISATTKPFPRNLSDAQDAAALAADLTLSGVALNVSSKINHRLAEDLASAQRTAQLTGAQVGAFCQWRADEQIANAYVVTDLASFVRLVRGEHLNQNRN